MSAGKSSGVLVSRSPTRGGCVPADLKKPKAADLEVSSDSSIGDGSDVEVVGVNAVTP